MYEIATKSLIAIVKVSNDNFQLNSRSVSTETKEIFKSTTNERSQFDWNKFMGTNKNVSIL